MISWAISCSTRIRVTMGKHGPMASPSFSSTASFQSMIAEYVIKNEIENQKGPKFGQVYFQLNWIDLLRKIFLEQKYCVIKIIADMKKKEFYTIKKCNLLRIIIHIINQTDDHNVYSVFILFFDFCLEKITRVNN